MERVYERWIPEDALTLVEAPTRSSFVKSVSAEVYAHLPERSSELQT